MQKRSLFLAIASLLLLVFLAGWLLFWMRSLGTVTEVIFLDIGQGDAILLQQGRNQVLIDGGRSGSELLFRLGRHIPFWDRRIEAVIATHPDSDHIGGLPAVLETYAVSLVLTNGATSDTETSALFEEKAKTAGKGEQLFFRGGKIEFPRGGALLAEYPNAPLSGEVEDTNATSIVTRFQFGETSFLFTGDLASEEAILPEEKPVTVLKVAHHGSKYSTSDAFLGLVQPKEAVISVGKNSYGHPNQDVLERLKARGISLRRTDLEGDIVYRCPSIESGCAVRP